RAPEIEIIAELDTEWIHLSVSVNGNGLPPETLSRILNFNTRTSDKAAYRTPTRGAQGNAFKTILGIPYALGGRKPVSVEAQGSRHRIEASVDAAGEPRIVRAEERSEIALGTKVWLALPAEGQEFDADYWAMAFALFNPHASVRICVSDARSEHA